MNRQTLAAQGMKLLAARYGHIWETDSGSAASGATSDQPCTFKDAGDAPCDVVSQSVAALPGDPSDDVCLTDARGKLGRAKPRSKAGGKR